MPSLSGSVNETIKNLRSIHKNPKNKKLSNTL